MAGTTLVKDALHRVSVLLHDVEPQFVRSPEIELIQFLNDAQRAVCKILPLTTARTDVIRLKAGTRQDLAKVVAADIKPGDGSVARDMTGIMLIDLVRNMGLDGMSPGRAVRIVDKQDLDASDPIWHTHVDPVARGVMFNPQTPLTFFVTPGVPSTRTWMELTWAVSPTEIPSGGQPGSEIYKYGGNNTTTVSIDDLYLDDLVNYMVARELMKDSKVGQYLARAQMFASAFLSSLNARAQVLTGNNPNLKTLPFAPDVAGAAS